MDSGIDISLCRQIADYEISIAIIKLRITKKLEYQSNPSHPNSYRNGQVLDSYRLESDLLAYNNIGLGNLHYNELELEPFRLESDIYNDLELEPFRLESDIYNDQNYELYRLESDVYNDQDLEHYSLSLIFTIFNLELNLVLVRRTLVAMISIVVVRILIHTDLNQISLQVVRLVLMGFVVFRFLIHTELNRISLQVFK